MTEGLLALCYDFILLQLKELEYKETKWKKSLLNLLNLDMCYIIDKMQPVGVIRLFYTVSR